MIMAAMLVLLPLVLVQSVDPSKYVGVKVQKDNGIVTLGSYPFKIFIKDKSNMSKICLFGYYYCFFVFAVFITVFILFIFL